jgi:hypothetical protein
MLVYEWIAATSFQLARKHSEHRVPVLADYACGQAVDAGA